jgi:hypothetical protein
MCRKVALVDRAFYLLRSNDDWNRDRHPSMIGNELRILDWIAYLSWFIATACLLASFVDELAFSFFFGLAGSIGISGVVFYAFSRVIYLLTEIRDYLRPLSVSKIQDDIESISAPLTTRSIAEISADISRMKKDIK